MPRVQNPSLGPGQAALLSLTTSLSSADILALSPGTKVVVPAPGAGKIIIVLGMAFSFHFGTVAYSGPFGDTLTPSYNDGVPTNLLELDLQNASTGIVGLVTAALSQLAYKGGQVIEPLAALSAAANTAVILTGSGYNFGPIVTSTLGAGGAGYAANDTGTITTGSGNATYKVLTVGGGGAVLTYQITAPGTKYATANGVATATGGAQPGVGVGFTVNITAVTLGDGTLKVTTYYQVLAVP